MNETPDQQSQEATTGPREAWRTSLYSAAVMGVFALILTTLMATTYKVTRPYIAASAEEARMRLINDILPPDTYDNNLLEDYVDIGPAPELGLSRDNGRIYRARLAGKPVALILQVIAPNGYSGRIDLVVAVLSDGRMGGVRVSSHKETPGLGDYIDPNKDRNKQSPWIAQFTEQSLASVPLAQWKVKRDGGYYDFRNGATISARAVTDASGKALAYAVTHRERLFDAETGSCL